MTKPVTQMTDAEREAVRAADRARQARRRAFAAAGGAPVRDLAAKRASDRLRAAWRQCLVEFCRVSADVTEHRQRVAWLDASRLGPDWDRVG